LFFEIIYALIDFGLKHRKKTDLAKTAFVLAKIFVVFIIWSNIRTWSVADLSVIIGKIENGQQRNTQYFSETFSPKRYKDINHTTKGFRA